MLMMHIDLGQILIAALVSVIGFLIKRSVKEFTDRLDRFAVRLDRHEEVIAELGKNLQRVIGRLEGEERVT